MGRGGLASDEATRPLRDYEIRDKKTGKITEVKEDFINTPLFNPYKILYDDSLEKGPKVQAILEQFKQQDAPQIGPFQMQEDIGTNIADLGFGIARATEPIVRGTSRFLGEISGIQGLKNFGGTQKFSPSINLSGFDLFKPEYESYVPTDEDRARFMLGGIERKDALVPNFEEEISEINQTEEPQIDAISQIENTIAPSITSGESVSFPGNALDLDERRRAYEQNLIANDEFGNPLDQRPPDVQVDEITSLLTQIQPDINIDKTEADSLLETENKFDGLSTDELKSEIDAQMIPAFNAQKEDVKKQVKIFEALESQDIDPDEYFNTARNPVSKKLNEPGFFGTDRFLNFIRNVGAGLVESGQMGPGLALGAAKAAEERAARDIAKDERKAEMEKLVAIEKAKAALKPGEQLKPKEKIDLAGQINADYNDVVSATNVLEVVDRVEAIILNEDTTGGKAIVQEFLTKVGSVFNSDGQPDPNGKGWDQLDSRTRAKVLLNQITQKNIRDILGESGKTISNLDRQIVENLVGSLKIGKTDAEVLEALNLTRQGINVNLENAVSRLKTNYTGMKNYGDLNLIGSPQIFDYINTGKLKDTIYSNQYASYSQPRTKITLAKD